MWLLIGLGLFLSAVGAPIWRQRRRLDRWQRRRFPRYRQPFSWGLSGSMFTCAGIALVVLGLAGADSFKPWFGLVEFVVCAVVPAVWIFGTESRGQPVPLDENSVVSTDS